ncbi:MAG: hypothetical protein HFACDABA_01912 [Anaerolineales bacterium]|nr:hypothetical protein [Anaerolineales bacterium]
MLIVGLILGTALLIWGRQLFWLFIAGAGFMVGLQIASRAIGGPEWVGIAIGLVAAIGAALLAVFLKTIAIGVGGFLMGGAILTSLAGLLGVDTGLIYWTLFVIGGIGGALLISMFFDLALIWLSSLAGASLIVGAFSLDNPWRVMLFLVLLLIGVVAQARRAKEEKKG